MHKDQRVGYSKKKIKNRMYAVAYFDFYNIHKLNTMVWPLSTF